MGERERAYCLGRVQHAELEYAAGGAAGDAGAAGRGGAKGVRETGSGNQGMRPQRPDIGPEIISR